MKIETKTIEIPAKIYQQTIYYANDGKEFYDETTCKQYEALLQINNHPVFKNSIEIETYYSNYYAVLYYLSSQEDYEFFLLAKSLSKNTPYFVNEYKEYGPGWYIYWEEDGGDGPDYIRLRNLDNYIEEKEKEFKNWKNEIFLQIFDKEHS